MPFLYIFQHAFFSISSIFNPFTTNGHLWILLCLTPDDFTRQRETLGGERVKSRNDMKAVETMEIKVLIVSKSTYDHLLIEWP